MIAESGRATGEGSTTKTQSLDLLHWNWVPKQNKGRPSEGKWNMSFDNKNNK